MNVAIYGTGYVGLITGACLAEVGNQVLCVDVDAEKIKRLQQGEIPIYEPGLESLVTRNQDLGSLSFSTDMDAAIDHGLFQFIAVGTPQDEDGSADLQYVLSVAESIGERLSDYKVIVDKSTVPVGTADKVKETIANCLLKRGVDTEFDIVSNPEFLKEGAAVNDFMKPDRIIVGTDNPRTAELMNALYSPFNRQNDRMITMSIRSAELTKYAANAMLATKISFINEMANLAEMVGADIEQVRIGIGSDPRIGYSFIYPGCGYGGSCFPKDVTALDRTAADYGLDAHVLKAVTARNDKQKKVLSEKVMAYFDGDLKGKTFALWGLAFKPGTDDMREAPSIDLVNALRAAGASIQAYDPVAMVEAKRILGDDAICFVDSKESCLEGADALIIVTEWNIFRSPDFDQIKQALSKAVIFDGRNLYDPKLMTTFGIDYIGVGRGNVASKAK